MHSTHVLIRDTIALWIILISSQILSIEVLTSYSIFQLISQIYSISILISRQLSQYTDAFIIVLTYNISIHISCWIAPSSYLWQIVSSRVHCICCSYCHGLWYGSSSFRVPYSLSQSFQPSNCEICVLFFPVRWWPNLVSHFISCHATPSA